MAYPYDIGGSGVSARRLLAVGLAASISGVAGAQPAGGCGSLPDASSRQAIQTFGDLRVCLSATNVVRSDAEFPVDWVAKGISVVLETQRPNDVRRLLLDPSRIAWTINGKLAPIDTAMEAWQQAVITLVDYKFEADAIRANAMAVRRQIDSIPGRGAAAARDSKRLELQVRAKNLEIQRIEQHERDLRERSRRIEQDLATANRRAAAERARASATSDPRAKQAAEASARNAEDAASRLDRALAEAERQGMSFNAPTLIADARDERDRLESQRKLAVLRLELANADSRDLSRELSQLDDPQRLRVLDDRVENARLALLAILEGRGKPR